MNEIFLMTVEQVRQVKNGLTILPALLGINFVYLIRTRVKEYVLLSNIFLLSSFNPHSKDSSCLLTTNNSPINIISP